MPDPRRNILHATQRAQDEDPSDDPLLEEFKLLRRRVFQWRGAGGWPSPAWFCACNEGSSAVLLHACERLLLHFVVERTGELCARTVR